MNVFINCMDVAKKDADDVEEQKQSEKKKASDSENDNSSETADDGVNYSDEE